jgi:hypothetical protein
MSTTKVGTLEASVAVSTVQKFIEGTENYREKPYPLNNNPKISNKHKTMMLSCKHQKKQKDSTKK